MRLILAIIMILASIVGFVVYIVPSYGEAQTLRAKNTEYETILANARKLEETRDDLLKKYNGFSSGDLERLETMLPQSPDNVKFILELSGLAERSGLLLQNVKVTDDVTDAKRGERKTEDPYGTVGLEFTIVGSYANFTNFLEGMESSLRLVDINKVSFVALDDKVNYQYTVGVTTYWLK